MMFYPLQFVGIKPFLGWQGLIPAKRREMAEIEVELVLGKLLDVREIAKRLDPAQITQAIERRLKQVLRRIVNDVMQQSAPTLMGFFARTSQEPGLQQGRAGHSQCSAKNGAGLSAQCGGNPGYQGNGGAATLG